MYVVFFNAGSSYFKRAGSCNKSPHVYTLHLASYLRANQAIWSDQGRAVPIDMSLCSYVCRVSSTGVVGGGGGGGGGKLNHPNSPPSPQISMVSYKLWSLIRIL